MNKVKEQPSNMEAEKALLGSVLLGGLDVYEKAKPWVTKSEAFYSTVNKQLWKSIQSLYRDKQEIDIITVLDRFKRLNPNHEDGMSYYVSGLPEDVPTSANVEQYGKIIYEKYLRREILKSAYKLQTAVHENQESEIEEILSTHTRLIEEIKNIKPSRLNDIETIVNHTKELVKSGNNIIKFGMPALDVAAGGMTRKEITVLGGRPGHGKTTLIVNIIRSLVEQNNKVMIFNREMSNPEMIRKLIVMESDNLSYTKIRKGDLNGSTDLFNQATDRVSSKYKDKLLMFDDVRTLDEAMVEISRHKPDVIIDDYIQLITMSDKKERRHQIEEIVQDYKWICKKEDCSAILVSQLNREIEKRYEPRPRLSDYSESGVIEQTAECALFIWYGYVFDDEEYSPYKSEIISAKVRYGRVGTTEIGFNGDRCSFYNNEADARQDTPQN
tara:strand:- start:132 stop:1454 length:1323 start_codon:yes stop_codon:yes gene_type:complete